MIITKQEMKNIFFENDLNLGFPVGAENGHIITDWKYHYFQIKYVNSDLKKFTELIKKKYSAKYELFNPAVSGSIGIKRKN